MLWRQMSGNGDWPQALTCTRLRDTTVRSFVATWTSVLPVWSLHVVGQAASAIPAEQARCVHGDPSAWLTWRLRSVQTAVVEVSCRWRRTTPSCSSPGDCVILYDRPQYATRGLYTSSHNWRPVDTCAGKVTTTVVFTAWKTATRAHW